MGLYTYLWLPNPFRSFANGHIIERNKMTETVTVIKKEPTCAELVDEQWKDRQEDLKRP